MNRNLPALIRCVLFGFSALAACLANAATTSPLSALQSVVITTDVVVHEDVSNSLPLVDVPRDLALAEALNGYLQKGLEKRGITVVGSETASVGLRYGYSNQEPANIRLPVGSAAESPASQPAPYWISEPYRELPRRAQLQNAFEDLARVRIGSKENYPPKSLSCQQLGASGGATHRLLVLAEAVQIPTKKLLTRSLFGLKGPGLRSPREFPSLTLRIGLVEIATGKFVAVEDCSGGWKSTVDDRALRERSKKFLAKLDRLSGRDEE